MIVKAHAKINLSLDVKNLRPDGYHDLETIMLPLELHDSLEISVVHNSRCCDDYITCDDFELGISKYNLCHKIIDEARKKWNFKENFNIDIHKNIFLRAGLGGGSADAAATLQGIVKLLKINASRQELIDLAINIGSDVPWALFNEPCLVKRKGHVLEPFESKTKFYVLLVKPTEGLSTQEVFHKGDELGFMIHGDINAVKDAFINGDEEMLGKLIFNSLEEPAFKMLPLVEGIKNKLLKDGLKVVLMSGSGSCVFGLTKDKKLVKKLEKIYSKDGYKVVLTQLL